AKVGIDSLLTATSNTSCGASNPVAAFTGNAVMPCRGLGSRSTLTVQSPSGCFTLPGTNATSTKSQQKPDVGGLTTSCTSGKQFVRTILHGDMLSDLHNHLAVRRLRKHIKFDLCIVDVNMSGLW